MRGTKSIKFFSRVVLVAVVVGSAAAPLGAKGDGQALGHTARQETAASETDPAFRELVRQAHEAREDSRLNEAIGFYRQVARMRPSWPEGWWYLGTLLYDLDRYAEARDVFRKLISIKPAGGPGWALLGLCEFRLREYDRAVHHFQRGRSLGVGGNKQFRYVTSYHTALLMTRFEKFEASFQILHALAREHYDSPKIMEALGLSVFRLPFLPEEIPPDRREMVLQAGRAAALGAGYQPEEARRGYQELVARYPNEPNVHYAFGVFLLVGEKDAALEEFRREVEISPSHLPARLQIAFLYISRAEFSSAHPFAQEAVKLAPRSFSARNALGRILLGMGELKEAVQELEIGVQLAPDSPEMHFALGRAYSRMGRKEDAFREQAEFRRLNDLRTVQRQGNQAVGGIPVPSP